MAETIQITKQEYSKLIATKGKYKALKSDYKSLESDYVTLVKQTTKVIKSESDSRDHIKSLEGNIEGLENRNRLKREEINKLERSLHDTETKLHDAETKLKNYSKLLEYTNYSRRRFRTQATKPNEYWVQNIYGTLESEIQQQLYDISEYQYDQSDDEVEVVEYNSEEDSSDSTYGGALREPESHTISLRDYTDKLSENFSKSFNDRLKRVCNNENKTKTNLKERTVEMTVKRLPKNIIEVKIEYISSQSFRELEETQVIKYNKSSTLGLWLSEL
jgi:chromosome segregation ATPase